MAFPVLVLIYLVGEGVIKGGGGGVGRALGKLYSGLHLADIKCMASKTCGRRLCLCDRDVSVCGGSGRQRTAARVRTAACCQVFRMLAGGATSRTSTISSLDALATVSTCSHPGGAVVVMTRVHHDPPGAMFRVLKI